jgi:hypothetical protein
MPEGALGGSESGEVGIPWGLGWMEGLRWCSGCTTIGSKPLLFHTYAVPNPPETMTFAQSGELSGLHTCGIGRLIRERGASLD